MEKDTTGISLSLEYINIHCALYVLIEEDFNIIEFTNTVKTRCAYVYTLSHYLSLSWRDY